MRNENINLLENSQSRKARVGGSALFFHGSQKTDLKLSKNTPLYATSDINIAYKFAKREIYGETLLEEEVACVYSIKVNLSNFYKIETDELYEEHFQDVSDWRFFKDKGFLGLIYKNYICIFPNTKIKIINMAVI
jgi:hypothetical protein